MPWVLLLQLIVPFPEARTFRVSRTHDRPADRLFQIGGHPRVVREDMTLPNGAIVAQNFPGVP